ncbi:MAG: hypothetical protein ACFFB0_13860 [Promethearchaeota archaeon]
MKLGKENRFYIENLSLKEDFKIAAIQWRYKKKIDKFLEGLQNKIIEKNIGHNIEKNIKITIE